MSSLYDPCPEWERDPGSIGLEIEPNCVNCVRWEDSPACPTLKARLREDERTWWREPAKRR